MAGRYGMVWYGIRIDEIERRGMEWDESVVYVSWLLGLKDAGA